MSDAGYRTLAHAIEDAASCEPARGFRFLSEEAQAPDGSGPLSTSFSYTAIERASARYGGALQALGLRKGDRVALILPANEDFVLCFFGCLRAGMVPVPIYPPLGLGQLQSYLDNTRHIVAKSGARALITNSKIKLLLGTVQASSPELQQVVAIEGIRESMEPLRAEKIVGSDVAFLQFTSGSTSRPKGVSLTHDNLAANIRCIMGDGIGITPEDVGVSWLPLYHDMGLIGFVLAPLVYRVPITFIPPMLFLKRPLVWLQTISRDKGTISFGPNFAYALAVKRIREKDLAGVDLSTWRVAGCGAEPIRPETLETFASTFGKVGFRASALMPSYGMAESCLAISFTKVLGGMKTLAVDGPTLWSEGVAKEIAADHENTVRLASCGSEFPSHSIRIFAPDDVMSERPLEAGKVGEIRIAGPSVMRGYWEDAERTRDAFAGPHLRTGDLGFLLRGELYICGRSKEVVIVNGRNYYPQDMEWEASKVEGVRKGNVIAFGARDAAGKDPDRERVVVAFEAQDAEDPSRAEVLKQGIKKAVQEGMGLTLDDVVAVVPGALPKTSSGKLQRAKTRELYEAGELAGRTGSRDTGNRTKIDLVKQAALSQLSYFKLNVLGGRKRD